MTEETNSRTTSVTTSETKREVKLPPPVWNPDNKSYGDFRFQVTLWDKACERANIAKGDRGYKLYDKLKDVKTKNVGDKITTAARAGDLDPFADDSIKKILELLDKTFKKDDLTLLHKAWSLFIHMSRRKEEKVDDYICRYETKMVELKRELKDQDLPVKVYAMQLIDSSLLSEKERQLVLTGINYDEANMFEQTTRALRKFFSGQYGQSVEDSSYYRKEIKQEVDQVEDVNISRGGWNSNYRGSWRGRGRGGSSRGGRGVYNGDGGGRSSYVSNNHVTSRGGYQNQRTRRVGNGGGRRRNPIGADGNILTCRICNSVFHFAGVNGEGCPESYENLQRREEQEVQEVEEGLEVIAEVCKSTHTEDDFTQIMYDGLLDSCCTANVMGNEWKDGFFDAMSEEDKQLVKELPTSTKFKFGGDEPIPACEKFEFPCYIAGEKTSLIADVVNRPIALLISKPEMKKRKFTVNLADDTLVTNSDKQIELN